MQPPARIPSSSLPASVKISELPDGVHYDLPRRPPDSLAQGGSIYFILFGVAFLAGGIFFSAGVTWTVFFKPGGMDVFVNGALVPHDNPEYAWWIAGAYILVLLPILGIGVSCFVHGIYVLVGRGRVEFVRIEVSRGRLHVLKQFDCLHWRRSRPLEQVRRLEVQEGLPPPAERPWRDLRSNVLQGNLLARCEHEKSLILAAGYPVALLKPLADELARHCRLVADSWSAAAIDVQDLPADGAGPRVRDASASPQGRVAHWPATESRLYEPNSGFVLTVCAGLALMGCVLLVSLPPRGQAVWLTRAFPVAFFGFGTFLYLAVAWSIRSRKPFRHAAPGVAGRAERASADTARGQVRWENAL